MDDHPEKRVNHTRFEQIQGCGAKTAALSCPFCMQMFADAGSALDPEGEVRVVRTRDYRSKPEVFPVKFRSRLNELRTQEVIARLFQRIRPEGLPVPVEVQQHGWRMQRNHAGGNPLWNDGFRLNQTDGESRPT